MLITHDRASDSRAPLECCAFPGLNRQIGVAAGKPFQHHGAGAIYVDITRETMLVNSRTFGNSYPEAETRDQVRQMTLETVAELDAVIAELSRHRTRLLESVQAVAVGE